MVRAERAKSVMSVSCEAIRPGSVPRGDRRGMRRDAASRSGEDLQGVGLHLAGRMDRRLLGPALLRPPDHRPEGIAPGAADRLRQVVAAYVDHDRSDGVAETAIVRAADTAPGMVAADRAAIVGT